MDLVTKKFLGRLDTKFLHDPKHVNITCTIPVQESTSLLSKAVTLSEYHFTSISLIT